MSKSDLVWERVFTFGSHTHLIKNKKTFCGRDVSLYTTEVHKFPTKKCKRCLELAYMFKLPDKLYPEPMQKVTA